MNTYEIFLEEGDSVYVDAKAVWKDDEYLSFGDLNNPERLVAIFTPGEWKYFILIETKSESENENI